MKHFIYPLILILLILINCAKNSYLGYKIAIQTDCTTCTDSIIIITIKNINAIDISYQVCNNIWPYYIDKYIGSKWVPSSGIVCFNKSSYCCGTLPHEQEYSDTIYSKLLDPGIYRFDYTFQIGNSYYTDYSNAFKIGAK
jgi:hypothetical protein